MSTFPAVIMARSAVLVLLACVIGLGMASVLRYDQERHSNNTSSTALYKLSFAPYTEAFIQFKEEHNRKYTDQEEIRRFAIFVENVKVMEAHNRKYHLGLSTYYMGVNQFADMTVEEYRERNKLGKFFKRRRGSAGADPGFLYYCNMPPTPRSQPPDSIDWVKLGAVTPVKNQGRCGSCWTFSATGSVEGHNFIKSGKLISLSEQQIVDCCELTECAGCGGGIMDDAFYYINQTGGLESESDYTYHATQDRCEFNKNKTKVTVIGCMDLPLDDEKHLKYTVGKFGPVSVAIDAADGNFRYYKGGVYFSLSCSSENLDHGVLVVGYGTYHDQDYWLVKNSWGAHWGMNGYIMMSRNRNNNCGIASAASYPTTALV